MGFCILILYCPCYIVLMCVSSWIFQVLFDYKTVIIIMWQSLIQYSNNNDNDNNKIIIIITMIMMIIITSIIMMIIIITIIAIAITITTTIMMKIITITIITTLILLIIMIMIIITITRVSYSCAKSCGANVQLYLHFRSFLGIEMGSRIVKILSRLNRL